MKKLQKDLAVATWHWQNTLVKCHEDIFVRVSFCQAAFLGKKCARRQKKVVWVTLNGMEKDRQWEKGCPESTAPHQ